MSEETVFRVTAEEKLAIRKSYDRSEKEIANDLLVLREWLKKQAHLPQSLDNHFLEMMLQRNKFSLEKTKSKLDTYFSVRNLIPEFYDERSMFSEKLQAYMKHVTLMQMPNLMKDLSRLCIFRFESPDSELFDILSSVKFFFAICDLRLYFDLSDSETFLIDCKNMKFGHAVKCSPAIIKKAITVLLKAYSDRIRGIHLINMQPYVNSIVTLVRSLLNDKLAARVCTHNSLESLHKVIAPEDLPLDFKGHQKSVADSSVDWKKYVESKNDWIMKQEELKSNEALRIGGPLEDDMFGSMHGSFRTLNVD